MFSETGSVQALRQAVRAELKVPVTARAPVRPAPVTFTVWSLPLLAVTVIGLPGLAPVLPSAGVMLSCTVSGDCDLPPPDLPPPLAWPLPEPVWQAAIRTLARQNVARSSSRCRRDRLSCSTPSSQ